MEYIEVGECCDVCACAIANDDFTGTSDAEEQATRAGIQRLIDSGATTGLVLGDEQGFSWQSCDVCKGLAGNRHAVGYLA